MRRGPALGHRAEQVGRDDVGLRRQERDQPGLIEHGQVVVERPTVVIQGRHDSFSGQHYTSNTRGGQASSTDQPMINRGRFRGCARP